MEPLLGLLIFIIIVAIIIGLIVALVDMAPFIAAPFKGWVRWALIAIGIILILRKALPMLGGI